MRWIRKVLTYLKGLLFTPFAPFRHPSFLAASISHIFPRVIIRAWPIWLLLLADVEDLYSKVRLIIPMHVLPERIDMSAEVIIVIILGGLVFGSWLLVYEEQKKQSESVTNEDNVEATIRELENVEVNMSISPVKLSCILFELRHKFATSVSSDDFEGLVALRFRDHGHLTASSNKILGNLLLNGVLNQQHHEAKNQRLIVSDPTWTYTHTFETYSLTELGIKVVRELKKKVSSKA